MVSDEVFYKRKEQPFGRSWEEWSAEWWKWLLSTTDRNNPVNDATGELQSIGQQDANVFFLAGTHATEAERIVNIPEGKAVFFPTCVMSASYAEFPLLKSEEDLRRYASEGNQVNDMGITLEGETFEGAQIGKHTLNKTELLEFAVKSPLFEVILPVHNIHLYAKGGRTEVVSDGYWVFLKPLQRGRYTLIVTQDTKDDRTTLTLNCSYVLTYRLLVSEKNVRILRR